MIESKKWKLADLTESQPPPDPIVFKTPGLGKPDTSINIFEQGFHVHSILLKMHSAFFRAFLDSPDKIPAPKSATFQYEYVSVVDPDGAWGLEPIAKAADNDNTLSEELDSEVEQQAFKCILLAMYSKSYSIHGTGQLDRIVALADFYLALPIVSLSINTAFWQSPNIHTDLKNPILSSRILICAKKLRNSLLFREAFTFVVSERMNHVNQKGFLEDSELAGLILLECLTIWGQISDASRFVLHFAVSEEAFIDTVSDCIEASQELPLGAAYFRRLYRKLCVMSVFKTPLVGSTAITHHLNEEEKWIGEDRFFCTKISDEDLPWDVNETEW